LTTIRYFFDIVICVILDIATTIRRTLFLYRIVLGDRQYIKPINEQGGGCENTRHLYG